MGREGGCGGKASVLLMLIGHGCGEHLMRAAGRDEHRLALVAFTHGKNVLCLEALLIDVNGDDLGIHLMLLAP